ncbi:MAG: energy transducer TonB [Gammaproteobacteria bacterium]|nr:energy transducer TonB [Gammaproteobacteria bacterium]
MNTVYAPIATTTSLSILLHGAFFAALLLLHDQAATTGRGIEIQLISSTMVADQQETEKSRKNSHVKQPEEPAHTGEVADNAADNNLKKASPHQLVTSLPADRRVDDTALSDKPAVKQKAARQQQLVNDEVIGVSRISQSTNAKQQRHMLIELLHSCISNNKEYPYLARRQRREGVATVGFVLHPDGTVKNPHLVASSHTAMLDRAALSAVKRIAPFAPAGDYIEQAEEFQIDVVFKLL